MNEWILLLIILGAIAVIVGVFVLFMMMQKKKKDGTYKELDYRAFFIMGICFLPMGIIFTTVISPAFIGLLAIGIIYMLIGLANRDKWK